MMLLLPLLSFADDAKMPKKWSKEPADYRGVPFGSSEDTLNKTLQGLVCSNSKDGRTCIDKNFLVGSAKTTNMFKFYEDQLFNVYISFNSGDYKFLKSVFIEKYGNPNDIDTEIVKTRFGVEYTNETLTWKGSNIILSMSKYGNTITSGHAMFVSNAFIEKSLKDEVEAKKKAAGSF